MIQQSSWNRPRTGNWVSPALLRGQNIYTYYHLQILETAKAVPGQTSRQIDVAVPGGTLNGMREMVPGAPALTTGSQYVVFLWTSRSGLTQIIGLSQGLFLAVEQAPGKISLASGLTAADLILDKNGKAVTDRSLALEWSDLQARIHKELGK